MTETIEPCGLLDCKCCQWHRREKESLRRDVANLKDVLYEIACIAPREQVAGALGNQELAWYQQHLLTCIDKAVQSVTEAR